LPFFKYFPKFSNASILISEPTQIFPFFIGYVFAFFPIMLSIFISPTVFSFRSIAFLSFNFTFSLFNLYLFFLEVFAYFPPNTFCVSIISFASIFIIVLSFVSITIIFSI
jgi:hypothetical protein